MFLTIIQEVFVGVVVSAVLEFWMRFRHSRAPRAAAQSQHATVRTEHSTNRAVIKIILAPLIGFVIAGLISGIIEAERNTEIPLGSPTATVLLVVSTFVVWILLSLWLNRRQIQPPPRQPIPSYDAAPPSSSSPRAAATVNTNGARAPELQAQAVEEDVTQRRKNAVDSILEDEALTADLTDDAAQVLIAWGVACAEQIVQSTTNLTDAAAAAVIEPRLRATRRLMRQINQWNDRRGRMSYQENAETLDEIIDKAAIIYGEDYTPPDDQQRNSFLGLYLAAAPPQMIAKLRALVERASS